MGAAININNKAVVAYTNKLEKLHKSHLPLAVRSTLNNLAFDVKKNTLMESVNNRFIVRVPSFFKKHSGVNKAQGFNLNSMQSEVGIAPGNNIAAKNLIKQETGGKVKKRSYIYMDSARVSKTKKKRVRGQFYLNRHNKISGKQNVRRPKKSKFIANAIVAERENAMILYKKSGKETAMLVDRISFSGKGKKRKAKVKVTPIANYKENREVLLAASPFLRPASLKTLKKAIMFYEKNAEGRFRKAMQI